MKALVWQGGLNFKMEKLPAPTAGPGRIVVNVAVAAVCGSDFHMDDFGATPPLVLGHEVAGVVEAIGKGVKGFKKGDRVALNPVQFCGTCWCCKNGISHLCQNYRHLGDKETPGGWAEYVAIDARNAFPVPDNVDFAAACLAEPLAVCYESFQRAQLKKGDTVLILGDGPFGFLHAQVARALCAKKIIVAGHYDQRLSRITQATGAIPCNTHDQSLEEILAKETNSVVDIVIEATGAGASPAIGIKALRPRGTLVIFSYIWKPLPLEMGLIHMKELNVLGSCRSLNAYPACIRLMKQKKVDTGLLVDISVPLDDYAQAIDRLQNHKEDVFKAVFVPAGGRVC
jgi:threonine dehydrogenase-like Zn-dependent dehydrogenase